MKSSAPAFRHLLRASSRLWRRGRKTAVIAGPGEGDDGGAIVGRGDWRRSRSGEARPRDGDAASGTKARSWGAGACRPRARAGFGGGAWRRAAPAAGDSDAGRGVVEAVRQSRMSRGCIALGADSSIADVLPCARMMAGG
jgi:hypothetical protein